MVANNRQAPSASATAWLADLSERGGPRFVVLRVGERESRAALRDHLVEIGAVVDTTEAEVRAAGATYELVGVIC